MKKFFTLFALVLFAACQSPIQPETPPEVSVDQADASTNVATSVDFALVALGDGTTTEEESIGCGDSIQMVESTFEDENASEEDIIRAALEALFAVDGSNYGESGLYNALYQSDLTVGSVAVSVDGFAVNVTLNGSIASGGTCDDPRIEAQIMETVKVNSPKNAMISITIDDKDLNEYFDMSGL